MRKFALFLFIGAALSGCHSTPKKVYPHTDVFTWTNNGGSDTAKFFGFTALFTATQSAKAQHKNMLVVFSGWSLSTSNIEWKALSLYPDPDFIQKNFVIAWIAVDDRKELDKPYSTVFMNHTYNIRTYGNQNNMLQMRLTKTNGSPTFCFLDTNLHQYGKVMRYTIDRSEVEAFIESGITR
jgi:hypothetical protein